MNLIFTIAILTLLATTTFVQGRLNIPSTKVTKVKRHTEQSSKINEKLMQDQADELIQNGMNNKLAKELTAAFVQGYSGSPDYYELLRQFLKETLGEEAMNDIP